MAGHQQTEGCRKGRERVRGSAGALLPGLWDYRNRDILVYTTMHLGKCFCSHRSSGLHIPVSLVTSEAVGGARLGLGSECSEDQAGLELGRFPETRK